VERWSKVYERLILLNEAFPPKICRTKTEDLVNRVHLPVVLRKALLEYVIDNKRILMGAEVVAMYDWLISKSRKLNPTIHWFLKKNGMIVFISPEAQGDALRLKEIFASEEIGIQMLEAKGEIIPERAIVSYRKMPFVEILQETACHSFITLDLAEKRQLLVASLETMLTFYYGLMMFTKDEKILQFYMNCLCQKLVEMSNKLHKKGRIGPIPAFSIECSGYQKGYATLLKEKFARIAREKEKQKSRKTNRRTSKTRKLLS
jgi:hypothetical protein